MTKEEYHAMKNEMKHSANILSAFKTHYKKEQKMGKTASANAVLARLRKEKASYRLNHIFMSLVRGKTREQIEQKTMKDFNEDSLIKLCKSYNVVFTVQQKGNSRKVISILVEKNSQAIDSA